MPIEGSSRKEIVRKVMHEYKHGGIHIGKSKKKVKKRSQAIAIALSESRRHGYK